MTDVHFDHYDEGYARDPYPQWEEMRRQCPVAHSDAHGGFWVASRYEDVEAIAHDPALFSSRYITVPTDIGFGDVRIAPLHFDPPEHTRIKRILATAFVPARIAPLEALTRETVVGLLDPLVTEGGFDASEDFARHVPTAVTAHVLGLPPTLERFSDWVRRILGSAADDLTEALMAAGEVLIFLSELLVERRAQPGDDFVSYLATVELDGERLSDEEIIHACAALLLAGIDTTWSALGATIHHLATNPEDQERLRAEPALIPVAREEFLRVFAPVMVARQATADTEVGGQSIKAGEMVMISFPSANRDEDAFPKSDEVVLDREPNRHLAFGSGIHRCLGANLARMELAVALEELLRRVPPFRLADGAVVEWSRGQVRGPRALPIVF